MHAGICITRVYLRLRSCMHGLFNLFSLIYVVGCQYKLQNDNGSFSSPNFLNNSYPDFQVCSWSVTVNASLRILLKLQTINIPNCEENYLDIYDGRHDNASTLLARFCGKNATSGAKVTSKMNNLYIVLKSGNNYARNSGDLSKSLGFYAEYEAFEQGTVKNFFL